MKSQMRRKAIGYNLNYRKRLSESTRTADYNQDKGNSIKYAANAVSYLSWKDKLSLFLERKGFVTYSCIMIIITLYLDDLKKILSTEKSDNAFDIISIIIIILSLLEVLMYFIADETYGCGLFFFVDIIGIVSLFLDISSINNKRYTDLTTDVLKENSNLVIILKILKSIKSLRIIRIGKLVKMFNRLLSQNKKLNKEDKKMYEEDIGSRFVDFSSKKFLIFFVLVLVEVFIFTPSNFYSTPFNDTEYTVNLFNIVKNMLKNNEKIKADVFSSVIRNFENDKKNILIFLKIDNLMYIKDDIKEKLRKEEISVYFRDCTSNINLVQNSTDNNINSSYDVNKLLFSENISLFTQNGAYKGNENEINIFIENKISYYYTLELVPNEQALNGICIAVYNSRYYTILNCKLNLIKTTFLLLIFILGYLVFSININTLVLDPIENMTSKIENMSKNPISSLESLGNEVISTKKMPGFGCFSQSSDGYEILESQVLEAKISKICSLLSLGFGEAGSTIISSVLQEGVNVEMNPIIPGKKVLGIYGFCDIRNFTDTTEILQEHVMIFVNQVAEIVHEITADYCGLANKNIGDAFLLVWKFPPKLIKTITNKNGETELKLKKTNQVSQFCDMALISFIKILMEINKSYKLAVYRSHPGLNHRMKNYRTKIGFGLHLGQSIEGAIGSMFKIDASYLSPDVDQANNLEENTKTFSKELIMSGEFYDFLSDDSKKNLRLLDKSKTKNGKIQRLYSIDLDLNILQTEKPENSNFKEIDIAKKMEKIKEKRKLTKILYDEIVIKHKSDVWSEFAENDDDFKLVREKYTDSFLKSYNEGMNLFINGNWEDARKKLENAQNSLGEEDPACQRTLSYMEKFYYVSPLNWKGYKENEK